MKLPIQGEYPPDWPQIADQVRADAGHRCIRCRHRYLQGQHGNGHYSPCDSLCSHASFTKRQPPCETQKNAEGPAHSSH